MKIIEVIPSLCSGGAEKFVIDLSNQFAKEGHEVTIVTLYDSSPEFILEKYISNTVSRKSLNKKKGFDLKCFFKLLRLLYLVKPNIVHAHVRAIPYLLLPTLFCRFAHYFATIHSEAKREAGQGIEVLIRFFLFKFKLVRPVTISPESQKSFKEFYHLPSSLILNGTCDYIDSQVNLSKYRDGIDFMLVHIGRLLSVKNQELLMKSVSRIVKEGYKVRLLVIGRKEDNAIYEKLKVYFSDNIMYLGEKQNPRDFLKIADAFCLSSVVEGMPISIIEAFSVGCIPICTPVGGCVDMIKNGENGLLAKDLSEEAYIDCLRIFFNLSAEVKNMMKHNARESYISLYSIQGVASKYLNLFIND